METVKVVFLILYLTVPSSATYKRWTKSTNFGDRYNWNAGRAPCGNDVVLIPDGSPVVYVQTNTTLKELGLPSTGEIIFGRNMVLAFTEDADPSCPPYGGDVEYTLSNARMWVNPENWCSTDTENGPCTSPPVLDSERIPCASDDTVFPREEAFYVNLGSSLNITVKSFKITGVSYTTQKFIQFISTKDGQRIFPPPGQGKTRSSVTVTKKLCVDPSGCACGNDQGQIFAAICKIATVQCPRPFCKKPFQPMGSCCQMCGAMFNATPGVGFNISAYRGIIQAFMPQKQSSTIQLMISKTGVGAIQTVLTDKNGDASIPIAKTIKADMDSDAASGGHKYRLNGIQLMESSGAIITTAASTGLNDGQIAGISVFIVFFLVFLVLGILFYRKRSGISQNMLDDLVQVPQAIQRQISRQLSGASGRRIPGDVTRPQYEFEMEQGFGNPLYGDNGHFGTPDVPQMQLTPTTEIVQPSFDADSGFDNPLYDTVQGVHDAAVPTVSSTVTSKERQQTDSNF